MFTPLTVMAEGSERKGKGDREKRGGEQAQIRIDACAGIAEGDACTFVGRNDEEVAGTCAVARNEALLCRVEGEGRGEGRRGGMGMGGNRGGKAEEDVQS